MKHMKPLNGLQTITLSFSDDPEVTLLPGKHDLETFNLAFRNEGWVSDPVTTVHMEYWIQEKRGWKKVTLKTPGAMLCTVHRW